MENSSAGIAAYINERPQTKAEQPDRGGERDGNGGDGGGRKKVCHKEIYLGPRGGV